MAGAVTATHRGECGRMAPADPVLGCTLSVSTPTEPQKPNKQNLIYEESGLFLYFFLAAGDLVRDVFLISVSLTFVNPGFWALCYFLGSPWDSPWDSPFALCQWLSSILVAQRTLQGPFPPTHLSTASLSQRHTLTSYKLTSDYKANPKSTQIQQTWDAALLTAEVAIS